MSRVYLVTTEKFGVLAVERDTIAEARAWARQNFGVRRCESCDSAPCCCPKAVRHG